MLSLVYRYHSADASSASTTSTSDNASGSSDGSNSGQGVCNREVLISYGFSGVNKPTNRPH